MDEGAQAEILWHTGVFLSDRADGEHKIFLYQIESFYVEVFYHQEQNEIKRLRSFRSTGQLRPYLDNIEIAHLI